MAGYYILRHAFPVDTSALDDAASISAATFNVKSIDATGGTGDNDAQAYANVYANTTASNTTLATTDWGSFGTTKYATDILCTTIVTNDGSYHSWTLNATGIAAINLTGYTKLSIREGHDAENVAIVARNSVGCYLSETAGTGSDPYLEVTYTISSSSIKTVNGLAKASVKTVNGLAIASVKTWAGLA